MMEQTLLLVKPDGVQRALIGKIISRIEDSGLKIVAMKMVMPDEKTAKMHYIEDREWMENIGLKTLSTFKEKGIESKETALQIGQRVHSYLTDYLTSGPVVAVVIEGNEAISIIRKIVGATEPRKADPSSIRGQYSIDSYDVADAKQRAVKNLIHASEDRKTAEREIAVWFKPGEIIKYKRLDQDAVY
jgi:nucleoside-diphosphate kinase